jgi:microcystin-dependent protein
MTIAKLSEYSTTPASNTDIGGININEGCSPANLNNAIRELMAQLRDFQLGNQTSNQLSVAGGGTGLTSVGTSGNVLTSNGSAWVSSAPNYVPTGGMMMWGTASAPTGYLLCNGAAVSRSTYSALFAVLGTAYGSGDGSTTFNVPDFRDRFPVGAGTTYSANSTGGSADATVVSHTHTGTTGSAGSATGSISAQIGSDFGSFQTGSASGVFSVSGDSFSNRMQGAAGTGSRPTVDMSIPDHQHSFTTGSAGSSGTNANLPPYLGVYFIIKT